MEKEKWLTPVVKIRPHTHTHAHQRRCTNDANQLRSQFPASVEMGAIVKNNVSACTESGTIHLVVRSAMRPLDCRQLQTMSPARRNTSHHLAISPPPPPLLLLLLSAVDLPL